MRSCPVTTTFKSGGESHHHLLALCRHIFATWQRYFWEEKGVGRRRSSRRGIGYHHFVGQSNRILLSRDRNTVIYYPAFFTFLHLNQTAFLLHKKSLASIWKVRQIHLQQVTYLLTYLRVNREELLTKQLRTPVLLDRAMRFVFESSFQLHRHSRVATVSTRTENIFMQHTDCPFNEIPSANYDFKLSLLNL